MSATEAKRIVKLRLGKPHTIRFNIMVVGETGSGKTTFLKTLFKAYCQNEIIRSELTAKTVKTVKIEEIGLFTLESEALDCEVHLFDSPGYGDYINNQNAIETVKNHLSEAHIAWLGTNGNQMTEKTRNKADARVHCVFYFIAPHRIKDIDKEFIKQLTGLAPIVLVVAKADTMTWQERKDHLVAVQRLVVELEHQCNLSIVYDFEECGEGYLESPAVTDPDAAADEDADGDAEQKEEDGEGEQQQGMSRHSLNNHSIINGDSIGFQRRDLDASASMLLMDDGNSSVTSDSAASAVSASISASANATSKFSVSDGEHAQMQVAATSATSSNVSTSAGSAAAAEAVAEETALHAIPTYTTSTGTSMMVDDANPTATAACTIGTVGAPGTPTSTAAHAFATTTTTSTTTSSNMHCCMSTSNTNNTTNSCDNHHHHHHHQQQQQQQHHGSTHAMLSVTAHAPLPKIRNAFAVVCDTSDSGKREYPWGSLDIYDEEHSDFRRLQRLVFESDHIVNMRELTQTMSMVIQQQKSNPAPPDGVDRLHPLSTTADTSSHFIASGSGSGSGSSASGSGASGSGTSDGAGVLHVLLLLLPKLIPEQAWRTLWYALSLIKNFLDAVFLCICYSVLPLAGVAYFVSGGDFELFLKLSDIAWTAVKDATVTPIGWSGALG